MPPAVKMRGRPKGCKLTVVGLPTKKGKQVNQPQAFINLHYAAKERGIAITLIV